MRTKSTILTLMSILYFSTLSFSQPPANLNAFNKFWQVFNDNYAFFGLHQVNWRASYQKHRQLVTENISGDSLFNIMSDMLRPLGDSHISLIDAAHKKKFNAGKILPFAKVFYNDSLKKAFWKVADSTLAGNGFGSVKGYGSVFKGKHLFYFARSAGYGYLRFSRCFAKITDGELDEKDFETGVLDSLMKQCGDLKGMIVDVRANIGGDDKFSYEMAGRFAAKAAVGHYKQERISGTGKYTKLQKWIIKPKGPYQFTRRVIVLTNDKTVSAAEVFTLAMKQLPNVIIIGTPTEGNLSDMYSEDLPNGWTVTLSNQQYYSPKMICYEGTGVPVDVRAENALADLSLMKDAVIAKAMAFLRK